MTDLYQLKFHVENELSGVPEQTVCFSLRQALREFCRRSGVWRENVPSRIDKNISVYSAVGIHDADLIDVESVLARKATGDCPDNNPKPWEHLPARIYTIRGGSVIFHPGALDLFDGGDLILHVILQPTFDSCNVPPELIRTYADAILAKTISDLAGQKNRPWFDPEISQLHLSRYKALLNNAMVHVKHKGFSG